MIFVGKVKRKTIEMNKPLMVWQKISFLIGKRKSEEGVVVLMTSIIEKEM